MVRQNKILFFVLSLIFSLSAFANQEEETPKFLLFLGRFHPLLLHLPIGALLLTFFMEIIGRIQKNDISLIISYALGFSAFFSVLTAIMGYLLSLEGGYGKDVLQIHMYAGFTMAGLTCLLYFTQKAKKSALKKSYLPLYLITLTLTIITGHYGSILTHGDTFLTTYSPISFEDEKELILETDSLYYYKNVITPILENKCVQCHNDNKIKGELNLTTIKHILACFLQYLWRLYKESIKGVFALSMADTLGSGEVPHPSRIIKITFLFMFEIFVITLWAAKIQNQSQLFIHTH